MCAPDIPDTSAAQNAATAAQLQLGERQADMQDRLIDYYTDRQDRVDGVNNRVIESQLETMDQTRIQAEDQYNYYRDTFRPVEQSLVAQAMRDSTPETYDRLAGQAAARTGAAFANTLQQAEDYNASMGVAPNSGRAASGMRQAQQSAAAMTGASYNDAYTRAEGQSWSRRADAAALGRGVPSNSNASYGTSVNAGSAASNNAVNANTVSAQGLGSAATYGGQAVNAFGNVGSQQASIYGTQVQAASQPSGLGQLAGMGFSYMMSSKKLKTDKKPVGSSESGLLSKIDKVPSQSWRYKQGVEDGGDEVHVGPYAEDMKEHFDLGTGDALSPMDTAGLALAGVQALHSELKGMRKAMQKVA
jgi:hypothetical protein